MVGLGRPLPPVPGRTWPRRPPGTWLILIINGCAACALLAFVFLGWVPGLPLACLFATVAAALARALERAP